MAGTKNLKNSRRFSESPAATVLCFAACAAIMAAATAWFYKNGATLYSGDAEAHLNIARRVVDTRTPGWVQLGTAWLPLPHLLMLPLVRNDFLWRTGLAGAIPSAFAMTAAVTFLFAAMRRIFLSTLAGATAAALFLFNPNTLYLGSVPMTEPIFFASLFGVLYFTVLFAETQGLSAAAGAGFAAFAGTLTRYEAWFLLPFVAIYLCRRRAACLIFCAIAGLGPLLWLGHNWWYFEDALYFYRGPWSAIAIQGKAPYPGKGDWAMAMHYFFEAGKLIAGFPALIAGGLGLVAAAALRAFWPLFLLALPPLFYVWSIHSSGTPVFVPHLEPHGWYNIRYAMAFLPLIALGGAALVKLGRPAAALVIAIAFVPFLIHWKDRAITLQEAEINSRGRREWTAQAAEFLKSAAGPNETYFTSFNDMTAIFRTAGIPLRDTLTGDNGLQFMMASSRPDLLLWEDWAVTMGGDAVQTVIDKARLHGPRFELSRQYTVKGQPVIEIYHRVYENPVH